MSISVARTKHHSQSQRLDPALALQDNLFGASNGAAGINDAFEVAWAASFTDGRAAVFVTNPVPEPAAVLGLSAVGLGVGWVRRQRVSRSAGPAAA